MPRATRWAPEPGQHGWAAGDPMTRAELVTAREFHGVTGDWIARAAGVGPRRQRRWESGETQIPDWMQALIYGLEELTTDTVNRLAELLKFIDNRGVVVLRTDDDYQAAAPTGIAMPARWHHHVAARASLQYPDVMLAFDGERAPLGNWIRMVVSVADLRTGLDEVSYTVTRTESAAAS